MPPYVSYDDIKAPFYEKMKELNFFEGEQFEYSSIEYKSNPVPIMTEFVNHNHEHYFDFVIFLNNPKKCETQKKDSNTFKYIKLLFANIGFCNYAYLDGYDYKVIYKLTNEFDDRKYLNKYKKIDLYTIKASIGMNKDEDFKNVRIGKEDVIHSEIYGVDNGQVYEKSSPSETTTIKTETKKNPEPKKTNVANNKKNVKANTSTNKNVKGKTGKK